MDAKESACDGYRGAICDCQELPEVAVCNGWCTAVDDPCLTLEGAYESEEELECGLGESGTVFCRWSLTFGSDSFQWLYSDHGEGGTYICTEGKIVAESTWGNSYDGTVQPDGSLAFDGRAYRRLK